MTSLAFPVPPKSRYAEATPLNPEASVVLDKGLGSHLQHLQVLLGPGPHIILAADVRPRYEGTESADPSPPPLLEGRASIVSAICRVAVVVILVLAIMRTAAILAVTTVVLPLVILPEANMYVV